MAYPAFRGAPETPSRKREIVFVDVDTGSYFIQTKRSRPSDSGCGRSNSNLYAPHPLSRSYCNDDIEDDDNDHVGLEEPVPTRPRPYLSDVHFAATRPPLVARSPPYPESASDEPTPAQELKFDFLVLERGASSASVSPSPSPLHLPSMVAAAAAPSLERTASGLSISSDTKDRSASTELLEDDQAVQRVRDHMTAFRRRNPDSKHERILRSIVSNNNQEYPIDDAALQSIFQTANEIFFNGRLSQRVTWDWSHASSAQYDSRVIGTTALRVASRRGFETLIVLSEPILRDARYSRRLLISTFLHELVHSYLFICCGFRAREGGGHTPGFVAIANIINDWLGRDCGLHLDCMEADLDEFRVDRESRTRGFDGGSGYGGRHLYYPCSGLSGGQAVDYYYEDDGRGWMGDRGPTPYYY